MSKYDDDPEVGKDTIDPLGKPDATTMKNTLMELIDVLNSSDDVDKNTLRLCKTVLNSSSDDTWGKVYKILDYPYKCPSCGFERLDSCDSVCLCTKLNGWTDDVRFYRPSYTKEEYTNKLVSEIKEGQQYEEMAASTFKKTRRSYDEYYDSEKWVLVAKKSTDPKDYLWFCTGCCGEFYGREELELHELTGKCVKRPVVKDYPPLEPCDNDIVDDPSDYVMTVEI